MSMVERRPNKFSSLAQRLIMFGEIKVQQDELREKMRAIQLFPGGLDEFVKVNLGEWEFIKLPGQKQFLEGGGLRWKEIDNDPKHLVVKRDLLHPLNWFGLEFSTYSAILVRAVQLGADALIYYTQRAGDGGWIDTGVPIRRIGPASNPQK